MRPDRFARLPLALLFLAVAGCAASAAPAPATSPAALVVGEAGLREAAESRISPERIFEHIDFLASDEMRGRDTPSPELERAAEYLAAHFASAGLQPAGDPGSFLQRWPFRRVVLNPAASRAVAGVGDAETVWSYGRDYFAVPAPAVPVSGSPVYVPDVASLAGGPPSGIAGRPLIVSLPEGLGPEFGLVIQTALSGGASGAVLIMDDGADASEISQIAGALEAGAVGQLPLPVVGVRRDVGEAFLAAAGIDLASTATRPVENATLSILSTFELRSDDVPNVVAILPGSDPELARTYVILTAHYDHVGVGPADASGDSIYNGADDNASGTSVLMQVAEALAALPTPPARSVVFLAVSGEEKGLLGSQHYARSATVDMRRVVANINMDMVGRNHPDTLFAIGAEYTTIGAMAYRIAGERGELGLVLAPDPEPEEQAFLRSDHFSFVEVGVPALFLTTWLHDNYHVPSDRPETIDAEKAARVGQFIFYLTHALASDPSSPSWTQEGEALLRDLSSF